MIFASLSAIFESFRYILLKKSVITNIHQFTCHMYFLSGTLMLFFSWLIGFPSLNSYFWMTFIIVLLLNTLAVPMYLKAIQLSEVSLVVPLFSFGAIFSIFLSFLLIQEIPSLIGMIGVLLICLGSYVLNSPSGKNSWLEPLRQLLVSKTNILMLISVLLTSIVTIYSKVLVQQSDVIFGTALVYLGLGLFFYSFGFRNSSHRGYLFDNREELILEENIPKKTFQVIFFLSVLLVLSVITRNLALILQKVSYVMAFRSISIIFSILLGVILLKEVKTQGKGFAIPIMGLGLVLVAFV
ncbi:MAG: EamA family transporter [Candidatus Heimdallarchaeota archaeon]|nr:MAG: EamA family transporter [Candidatus Heimdallarchaeota archaeon]